MTETTELPTSTTGRTARGAGLSGMVLADLKTLAGQLGIKGTSGMRKGDLVAAIAARQGGSTAPAGSAAAAAPARSAAVNGNGAATANGADGASGGNGAATTAPANGSAAGSSPADPTATAERRRRVATRRAGAPDGQPALTDLTPQAPASDRPSGGPVDLSGGGPAVNGSAQLADARHADADRSASPDVQDRAPRSDGPRTDGAEQDRGSDDGQGGSRSEHGRRNRRNRRDRSDGGDGTAEQTVRTEGESPSSRDGQAREGQAREDRNGQGRDGQAKETREGQAREDRNGQGRDGQPDRQSDGQGGGNQQGRHGDARRDDDDSDGGRRRGRRFRDRNRRGRERYTDSNEPEVREDDVLVPVAGIVDVLDSYAFVRTSGYLAGPNDVYVSLSQVRKYGLRRGDKITGAIRAPREGEQAQQRQKFNPLVRLDTINELEPDASRHRPEFTKLTPLYPNERLRLETEPHILTTRVIDLVMPVGKGQRALIVSPPKAGKTSVLQAVANAITTNNPECHLMVVLVDERPEEVTDMQRSVKGEVIASTFDRPPSDHTMAAELSIERAKRLVEMGRDVVVLLDSITRLGRAYNLAAPASGRILSGGVDSTALFPPKRFLGAARNIENGGSLTIFASALVETGSAGDTVIFEEFKGTGNAELKLDRRLADKRMFPAIDIDASSTRKEDLLMSPDELAVTVKLRRVLSALEPQQALELVLDRLRKTRTNIEFLMTVAKTTPGAD